MGYLVQRFPRALSHLSLAQTSFRPSGGFLALHAKPAVRLNGVGMQLPDKHGSDAT